MNRGSGRTLAVAIASWLASAMLGCGSGEERVVASAPPVMVVPVATVDITDRIEATGQLLAKADAHVAAQVNGQVTEIVVDEGAAVEADAVILEIDPERRTLELANQKAQVVETQAQLEKAQRNRGRIRRLYERKAVSQAQVDEADTDLRLTRARLQAATAQLGLAERAVRDSTVRAPFTGFISRRHVNPGEFVTAGAPLFDLVALDPIEVEFHLSEADSSRVRLGVPVAVRVAPFPEEEFEAVVTVVSPTIDSQTRTLRVKASIDNRDGRLRPGLFARANLGVAQRSAVVMVPEDAILQRADGSVVFVMDGDEHVRRVRVETGIYQEGKVEIRNGIGAGELVVVRGQTDLIHGSKVSLRNDDGSPAGASPSALGATLGEEAGDDPGGAGG